MKRIFGLILVLIAGLLVLSACASYASRENIATARQALEIADDFLFRRNISPETALSRVSRLPNINVQRTGNRNEDEANAVLRNAISRLESALRENTHIMSAETRRPVVEARNQIAAELGVRTRR